MQEEVEARTVALAINSSKMSGRILQAALRSVLIEMKRRKNNLPTNPRGKQSVKQLIGQNAGVSNIDITASNIKSFERVARKYNVDYALRKDITSRTPKFLVFFKARDADALTAAFTEFTTRVMKKQEKPSILAQLDQFKALVKANFVDRTRLVLSFSICLHVCM